MRTPILNAVRPAMRGLAGLYFKIRFEGTHNIPANGPLVIVANHVTYADPPLLSIPIRRPVHYMAWDALFRVPVFGWLIRRLRAFPVDIDGTDARAAREAVRLLDAGAAVLIFPEGGRSADGRLGPFRPGAFRLAASRAVPVLPVTIVGGHECWPPSRRLPRPGRVTIVYHRPAAAPRGENAKAAACQFAAAVRGTIATALPAHQQ